MFKQMSNSELNQSRTVLITGGAGFVGHHVLAFLLEKTSWNLISLDRLDFSGNLNRIADAVKDMPEQYKKRLKIVHHDLKAEINADVRKAIGTPDIVLHIAAASHVQRSIKYPLEFIHDNVIGTANLLEFTRTLSSLTRFIYFSTDEVFGPSNGLYSFNEYDRYNSTNPYSASKAAAEEICVAYANTYKLPIYITHTMNIFGERQSSEKYIPMCAQAIYERRKLTIHQDPVTGLIGSRSYLYVKDIADALLFLIDRNIPLTVPDKFAPLKCPKFNIAGEIELNNLEVAQIVSSALNIDLSYEFVDPNKDRPGHDLRYLIDGSAMAKLGWQPKHNVRDMIGEVAKFSVSHNKL
jgi:dTDP-glucose 4,6-dehydratase